jgi:hypothetical protein
MKVLIDHHEPFAFAPGGLKVQIEQTLSGLRDIGVSADYFRWWDTSQAADILHFFGIPHSSYLARAQAKGMKVVITHLLTHTCNRPSGKRKVQAAVTRLLLGAPLFRPVCDRMGWVSLRRADAVVVGLKIEADVMRQIWDINPNRLHVIPLGLPDMFRETSIAPLQSEQLPTGPFLITVGTICRRKYSVELARFANEAQVPIVFVGQSLPEESDYWTDFLSLCKSDFVWHYPYCEDARSLAALYAASLGFVHFSTGENWCLAAHEAAGCRRSLLLRDQPWSRECFGRSATFWTPETFTASTLKAYFLACQKPDPHPHSTLISWTAVAERLQALYLDLLRPTRAVETTP